jgi:asparagine synthase (glutamine-hydrolysing)
MAFSVEARVPFLDYRLVEYLFSLPASLKIRDGWTKWILRQAMQGILPEEIRLRKDKLGFPTPQGTWLQQNKKGIRALFSSGNLLSDEYINTDFIINNLDNLLSNEGTVQEVWQYINLELWLQVFFGDMTDL